ncbi:hypothetical protein E2562_030101 [Oryza meyeriana var. granulata]|uniref:Uncharacterized protein n=1 Tax=Oryza meyeriana var. granulata TaxID=110450 RepID=A0A6G1CV55_9ORYZ|nr:hypothetical protein E2562_030101 [Oryza meyeriana var. granulata]
MVVDGEEDDSAWWGALTATLLVSFAFFLASLPSCTSATRHLVSLQSRGHILAMRLLAAKD